MPLRTATIATGAVEGVPGGNPTITIFKGIPFAAPTSGRNRFRPPQPPAPWSGVLRCDRFPDACVQGYLPEQVPFGKFFRKEFYPVETVRSEDALRLNVWTPAESTADRLPVMVWIHGGGYGSGYGHEMEFDGEALAKRGVLLVTIQYRLGALGFLAHPDLSRTDPDGVSGNAGFLDQVAALRWVRDNAAAFGGDPGNVTIFGQSAGGGSVLCHLASPLSKGLFHRAIVQSGTFLIASREHARTLADAEAWGEAACKALGKGIEELQAMPAEELRLAFEAFERGGAGNAPKMVVDGHAFVRTMAQAVAGGHLHDVPVMTGSVEGDAGLLMYRVEPGEDPRVAMLRFRFGDAGAAEFLARHPLDGDGAAICDVLMRTASHGDAMLADALAANGRRPAYVYSFDPEIPGGDEFRFVADGLAYHSAELWYVFGTLDRCWRRFDGRHHDLAAAMEDYWTNFAKAGDPNGPGLPRWEPFTERSRTMLEMNEKAVRGIPATTPALESFLEFFRTQA